MENTGLIVIKNLIEKHNDMVKQQICMRKWIERGGMRIDYFCQTLNRIELLGLNPTLNMSIRIRDVLDRMLH